uniref:Peptidase S74 domain-containing protein n=1 Tax=viral metagenome TaxID=1070528 RepID=A0A6C0HDP1_9ZZZZ
MAYISFSGKQPNYTAYIKTFPLSPLSTNTTWTNTSISNTAYLTPSNANASVYIKNDLLVGGSINNPSDFKLKENIEELNLSLANDLLKIEPIQYTYKADDDKKIHYGVIAQDLESYFPNLVSTIVMKNDDDDYKEHKVVNYLELVPLLIVKIKDLQKQIDELKGFQ